MSVSPRVALLFNFHQPTIEDHRPLLAGICRYAEAAGWVCTIDPHAADHPSRYDGIIGPTQEQTALRIEEAHVPFVGCTPIALRGARCSHVCAAPWRSATHVVNHLVACGYTTFGYVGLVSHATTARQEEIFRRTVGLRGFSRYTVTIGRTYGRYRAAPGRLRRHLAGWLARLAKPLGVFAATDVLARTLADLCIEQGLNVPAEVGLVGSGNDPVFCTRPAPALTSVDYRPNDVGHRAAALLGQMMISRDHAVRRIYLQPQLVVRGSTNLRWRDDPLVANAIAWIDAHCAEPIRVPHAAQAVGVGERELRRRFACCGRTTVAQHIVRARLRRAAAQLLSTTDSVDHIARHTGFADGAHLSQTFRKQLGTTPTAFRRRRLTDERTHIIAEAKKTPT